MNIEVEARELVADIVGCPSDRVLLADLELALTFAGRIRAAILADEERRAWMERYADCHELWGAEAARVAADRFLDRWREARAAWEARDERQ